MHDTPTGLDPSPAWPRPDSYGDAKPIDACWKYDCNRVRQAGSPFCDRHAGAKGGA